MGVKWFWSSQQGSSESVAEQRGEAAAEPEESGVNPN